MATRLLPSLDYRLKIRGLAALAGIELPHDMAITDSSIT